MLITVPIFADAFNKTRGRHVLKIENRIFTAARLRLWSIGLILAYAIVLARMFFSERWLIRSDGGPVFADFVWMWVGGQFAFSNDPVAAYVYSNFAAAQVSKIMHSRRMARP
jgi:hypothetical protein